jgi:hypothetical protein
MIVAQQPSETLSTNHLTRVVYLQAADKCKGPVPRRAFRVHWPVMNSQMGVAGFPQ